MKAGAGASLAAALLATALLCAPQASASGAPASWSAYRAAAQRASAAAARAAYTPSKNSALRAQAVRWPDGLVSPVQPQPLLGGLLQAPASPQGAMSRAVLRRIAHAPAAPGPGAPGPRLRAALQSLLREPAYARLRPGPLARVERTLVAAGQALLARLGAAARVLLRQASAVGGPALALAGAAALALFGWGVAVLVRRGFEPRSRRAPPPSPAAPPGPPPDALLAQGDRVGAVRAAYRQLLDAAGRQGTDIRPGWTAARLLASAPLTKAWPGFDAFARFHDRICFGPADASPPSDAEVAFWLREVDQWRRVRPRREAAG